MKHVQIGFFLLLLGAVAAADKAVEFEKIQLTDVFYSEGGDIGDFNKDGKKDVVVGPYWYEGPDFTKKHEVYPPVAFEPKKYSDNFLTYVADVSGDGWDDVFVMPWPGKESFWFENPAGKKKGHWDRHVSLKAVDNESPLLADINGDGKVDLICQTGGHFGYATMNDDPRKEWTFHRISPKVAGGRYTHGLGIGDVNGDGKMDLLEKGSWWKQPDSLEGDPEWKRYTFQFTGPGGSQMYAYDFDDDGDNDIVTSLAAHAYGFAWFEQTEDEKGKKGWERHLIMGGKPEEKPFGVSFSQTHSVALEDIDGDGVKDIVTGKRYWAHGGKDPGGNDPAVLYWFKTVRGGKPGEVGFEPHMIDDDSGVGTQVEAGDVNGDGRPDIVVGNKKGAFIHLQKGGRE